jgi:ribulose-phosphate 3-epimerase
VRLLEDIIADVDIVLVMTVNPGFGGQKFIEHSYQKIAALKELIAQHRSHALIEVDGGVNEQNTPALIQAGAQILVAGNFIFSSSNPTLTIENLKNTVISYEV